MALQICVPHSISIQLRNDEATRLGLNSKFLSILTRHVPPFLESGKCHAAAKRTKAGWRGERSPPQQRGLGAGERPKPTAVALP